MFRVNVEAWWSVGDMTKKSVCVSAISQKVKFANRRYGNRRVDRSVVLQQNYDFVDIAEVVNGCPIFNLCVYLTMQFLFFHIYLCF